MRTINLKLLRRLAMTAAVVVLATGASRAQEGKPAYAIYDKEGKTVTYGEMVRELAKPDVVFRGEIHNCPVTHWLEFEIARSLQEIHGPRLTIGEEMLESDVQLIVDEFLQGKIAENRFEAEARLWDNYATDYKPVTILAKSRGIRLVATNVPRRYAASVNRGGLETLDSLSDEAKRYMAPLPVKFEYDEKANREKFQQMIMMTGGKMNLKYMAQAQALKDATMAWFIARNLDGKFLHLNGSAHSDWRQGIVPYLLEYRPGTTIATVKFTRQQDIGKLDEQLKGAADFIVVIPVTMTTSY